MVKHWIEKLSKQDEAEAADAAEHNEQETVAEEPSEEELGELRRKARRAFDLGRELSSEEASQESDEVEDGEPEEGFEEGTEPELDSEEDEELEEDPVQSLEQRISELEAEAAENYDKYLRAVADLENFKKRTLRERSDLIRYAGEHLAYDLLEVVDDLERAVAQDSVGSVDELMAGLRLILKRVHGVLEKHSIKGEDSVGEKFDPTKHEALATVPSAEHTPGTVMEQLKKPFLFKDKLLRPGQVVVSAAVEGQEQAEENEGADEAVEDES